MNKIWKKVFYAVLIVGLMGLSVGLWKHHSEQKVKDFRVTIVNSDLKFCTQESIFNELKRAKLLPKAKEKIGNIDLKKIEFCVEQNPFVKKAEVIALLDGSIEAKITQRQPILRVINTQNEDFYIDSDSLKMPIGKHFAANVLVATGTIAEKADNRPVVHDSIGSPTLLKLNRLAHFIAKDSTLNAVVVQINATEKQEFEIISRYASPIVLLGDSHGLEEKFDKLLLLYRHHKAVTHLQDFTSINLKYKNQIICK